MGFGFCARAFDVYFISEQDPFFDRARSRLRLEHGLVLAALLVADGPRAHGRDLGTWASRGFGALREERLAIVAATVIAVGAQIFFTSFLSVDPRSTLAVGLLGGGAHVNRARFRDASKNPRGDDVNLRSAPQFLAAVGLAGRRSRAAATGNGVASKRGLGDTV